MKTIILTEYGHGIGLGHLSRCEALNQALRWFGQETHLIACKGLSLKNEICRPETITECDWKSVSTLNSIIELHKENIVIDSYLADRAVYDYLSEVANSLFIFDDYGRLEYKSGYVINSSIEAGYQHLTSECDEITYLLGPKFQALRNPFWCDSRYFVREKIKKIIVALGSGCTNLWRKSVDEYLKSLFSNITILYVGSGEEEWSQQSTDATLIHEKMTAEEIRQNMIESDLAFCSGSQISFELANIGIPSVIVQTAVNQEYTIRFWKQFGGMFVLEDTKSLLDPDIASEVLTYASYSIRNKNSRLLRSMVDGQGAKRLARLIFSLTPIVFGETAIHNFVSLNEQQHEMVLNWRNDTRVRRWMGSSHIIDKWEHSRFIRLLKTDPSRYYGLVFHKKNAIGVIDLTNLNFLEMSAELGLYKNPNLESKGVGNILLQMIEHIGFDVFRLTSLKLRVKEQNTRAKTLYIKARYKIMNNINGYLIMEKWHER